MISTRGPINNPAKEITLWGPHLQRERRRMHHGVGHDILDKSMGSLSLELLVDTEHDWFDYNAHMKLLNLVQ